jgi:hypothetical protein
MADEEADELEVEEEEEPTLSGPLVISLSASSVYSSPVIPVIPHTSVPSEPPPPPPPPPEVPDKPKLVVYGSILIPSSSSMLE